MHRSQDEQLDFRHTRTMLPPEAFALSTGPNRPPSDLVDEDTWRGITTLPDDVSLRTSDHYGSDLRRGYDAWGGWVSLALALQYLDGEEANVHAPVVLATFVITDELQSSLYSAVTGFYRASIGGLRLALEGALIGLYFTLYPDPARLRSWGDGREEVWMRDVRRALTDHEACSRFEGLMGRDGWVDENYQELSRYSHGRMGTTNVDLWEGSNGPIYVPESFELWQLAFVDSLLLITLLTSLAEPRIRAASYPDDFSARSFVDELIAWHSDPPDLARELADALLALADEATGATVAIRSRPEEPTHQRVPR